MILSCSGGTISAGLITCVDPKSQGRLGNYSMYNVGDGLVKSGFSGATSSVTHATQPHPTPTTNFGKVHLLRNTQVKDRSPAQMPSDIPEVTPLHEVKQSSHNSLNWLKNWTTEGGAVLGARSELRW